MINASEAKYRRLFEGMLDGYVRTDLDGKIQEFNTAYLKMHGYSEEELLSMTCMDLTPEKWHSMEAEIIEKQTLVNGYSELYEKEYRRKDGTLVPIELKTYLERDEDNKPVGYWAIVRDISNRKRFEEALRSSELKYWQLSEQSPQGIVLIQETGIVFVNQALANITGISIEKSRDMDMEDIWEMIHPDDRSLLIRVFAHMFVDQKMPSHTEFRVIRKDGGVRWVEGYAITTDFDGEATVQAVILDITEKRQAEEKLRKSKQKYHMLFDTSMDGIAFTSMDGAYLEVNYAFSDMVGYSQEELLSMDYHQVTPDRWREREQEIHETHVIQRGYSDEYEKEYMRKDGTIIPAMIRTWLVRDENGKPAYVIATVRDITGRKRAKDELRESEEKHRTLVNSMQDLVLVYDKEDRHAQVYAGSEDMLYVSPEEFLTKRIVDVLPTHVNEDYLEKVRKVRATGNADTIDYWLEIGDKTRWFSAILSRHEDGESVVAVVRDITDRKKAEGALMRSEELFRAVFEHADIGILIGVPQADGGLNIIDANPAFQEFLGYDRGELSEMRLADFSHRDEAAEDASLTQKLLGQVIDRVRKEKRYVRKNEETVWGLLNSSVIRDSSGNPLYLVAMVEDVTERKRAQKEAKAAAETAMLYLDLMGHDIRNHLQAILMGSDILGHIEMGPEAAVVFDLIVESVQSSEALIRKALVTRGLLSAPLSKTALKDALETALKAVKRTYEDVEIKSTFAAKRPLVMADEYLGHMFTNLLENAVIHNPRIERRMWVHLSETDDGYMISIADNGTGVSDAKKETLFDPNRRFGGIGIHQARQVVEKYGGQIGVTDRIAGDTSKGAKFTVQLPKFRTPASKRADVGQTNE